MLEGTEYRVVDTEDGQVASVTLTLDPDEEVSTVWGVPLFTIFC